MSFWTAAVIIVAIVALSGIYRAKFKANEGKLEGFFNDLSKRISQLEDRMANLETIVLEKEKTKKFAEIEKEGI